MLPPEQRSPTRMTLPVDQPPGTNPLSQRSAKYLPWLQHAIFFFLMLFAILLPHSIKGARHAWEIVAFLWLAKMALERTRPIPQPLSAPLLAFLLLSGISTALSSEPYLSWPRMLTVCFVAVAILIAQNVSRWWQVRMLLWLLLLSGLAAAAVTAWQYTYGVGVEVKWLAPQTPLSLGGILPGDIIQRVDGHSVHTPSQLTQVLQKSQPQIPLRIDLVRGTPFHRHQTYMSQTAFINSGLGAPYLQLTRGKPVRAQGTLGHYMEFAEVLMQIGCLAWALLLGAISRDRWPVAVLLGVIFLAVTATLLATQTRSDLAGLAAGCLLALLLLARSRVRIFAFATLVLLLLTATVWIQHTRKLGWLGSNDAGTHYRLLMWEDGSRLIRQHPWFGVGMDTVFNHWQEWNLRAYAQYRLTYHFHSDYVQIAVERGLPALAAWLWFEVAYLVFLFRLLRKARQHSRFATAVVAGLLASFVGYLVPSLVQYCLGDQALAMIFFFYVGLALAIDRMLATPTALDVQ